MEKTEKRHDNVTVQTHNNIFRKIMDPQPPKEHNLPAHQIQIGWHWIRQCKITKKSVGWMKHQLQESI
jgi:hypothetical protein